MLDLALLAEISGGDAAVREEILASFHQANELDAAALRRAVGRNDLARAKDFSHRLKGATRTLGATRLAQVCARIEAAGAAGDSLDIQLAMGIFETELLRLNRYLEALA